MPENKPDTDKIKFSLEFINPEEAEKYLNLNFDRNRRVSKKKVAEYAREMNSDSWNIGCDAIAFDETGKLINGQHRLHAVTVAQKKVPFAVIRGLPYNSASTMDIGRRRKASERQYILGYDCNEAEFGCVRNALVPWAAKVMGPQFFRDNKELNYVSEVFDNHRCAVKFFCKTYPKLSNLYKTVALKIFAEMHHNDAVFNGMDCMARTCFFLDLVQHGFSEKHLLDASTDSAAIVLKNYGDNVKAQRTAFARKSDYRIACHSAYNFMIGNGIKAVNGALKEDPFSPLGELKTTNTYFGEV